MRPQTFPLTALIGTLLSSATLLGQSACQLERDNTFAYPGAVGATASPVEEMLLWDPDGPGPQGLQALMAGPLLGLGYAELPGLTGVGAWNPANSEATLFPPGFPGGGRHIATDAAGGFYASGADMLLAPQAYVYHYDGQWTQIGGPGTARTPAFQHELLQLSNGDLLLSLCDRDPGYDRACLWNGSSWSDLGLGFGGNCNAMLQHSNGDIYVAGTFVWANLVDGQPFTNGDIVNRIARWNGTQWVGVGGGMNGTIRSLVELPTGDILATGEFTQAGGFAADRIAIWDEQSWHALPGTAGQLRDIVHRVLPLPNGDLVAMGRFQVADGSVANRVARYDGTGWQPLGNGIDDGEALDGVVFPDGQLLVCGAFTSVDGLRCISLATWDGAEWDAIGHGTETVIADIDVADDGKAYAVGTPYLGTAVATNNEPYVWDGDRWNVMVGGPANASDIDVLPGGQLLASGGGVSGGVQLFDGMNWSVPAPGISIPVITDAEMLPSGQLLVGSSIMNGTIGGQFNRGLGIWDGTSWINLSSSQLQQWFLGQVYDLQPLPDGNCLVVGDFTAGQLGSIRDVAVWNGTEWSALANGLGTNGPIYEATVSPDGIIYVGGDFTVIDGTPAAYLARYVGGAWEAVTAPGDALDGAVREVCVMIDGDIVVNGDFQFAGSTAVPGLARLNGGSWEQVTEAGPPGFTMIAAANGDLWLSNGPQRLSTPCGAEVTQPAAGCPSSGGANTLTAVSQPWLGMNYQIRGEGLPSFALVAIVTGYASANVPLSIVSPQAGAGCALHVSPDVVQFVPTTTGIVDSNLLLPNAVGLVGVELFQQMVPFEIDTSVNVLEVTATNSLRAVLGSL